MALPSKNLDDLDYQRLLDILKSQIRGEEWSDHNPSDPGIALLELITWLGEMELYRLNRVPDSHRDKFLKLIVDPPVPVTTTVTFRLIPPPAVPGSPPRDLELPVGLRVATEFQKGRRFVFESFSRAVLPKPESGKPQLGQVTMRAIRELENVVLGVSDGTANQTFPLPAAPVVIDLAVRPSGDPGPNAVVQVEGDTDDWLLRASLLTPASGGSPAAKHFMIDEFENRVRFGDGKFGAIPGAGTVRLVHCQVLEDSRALVAEGDIKHWLNPEITQGSLQPGERLEIVGNSDAEGGENFPPADEQPAPRDERIRRGLESFRKPSRLVNAADFERVATTDFNAFQTRFNAARGLPPDKDTVRRAVAIMNRKPPLFPDSPSPGHVTLMVLPETGAAPSLELQRRLLAYLEPHRLITTRLHVVGPKLKSVSAQVIVVIERQRNESEMQQTLQRVLREYLDLETGYEDGAGWPLGRAVRRSQLFRLLEDVPGVDHVQALTLSPANSLGDIDLDRRELPEWDALLSVQVTRA